MNRRGRPGWVLGPLLMGVGAGSGLLSFWILTTCLDSHLVWGSFVAPAVPFWLVLLAGEALRFGRVRGAAVIGLASVAGWAAAFEVGLEFGNGASVLALGAASGAVGAVLSGLGFSRLRWPVWRLGVVGVVGAAAGLLLGVGFYVTFAVWQAAFMAVLALFWAVEGNDE